MAREVKYPNFIGVSVDKEMLKRLKELLGIGKITKKEFDKKRKQLLKKHY